MDIMLFHSSLGLRPGVHAAAERLRAAGHRVHLPDLYDGQTADTVDKALEIKEGIGWEELVRRAVSAAAPHSDGGLVYAGFSLGAAFAQMLAQADEKVRGLVLLSGTYDVEEGAAPLDGLPVQLHVADPDPYEPDDWLNTWYLHMTRAGADVEVHRYRGAGHLYTDPDLPDYDEEAAERTWATVQAFLESL